MEKIRLKNLDIFRFSQLNKFKSITHFVTGRRNSFDKSLSLSLSSVQNAEPIIENRKLLAQELQIPIESFVFQQQEHTKNISVVTAKEKEKSFYSYENSLANNDGMVTNEKNICLMIMGADCVPILFYDPIKQAIGGAHAGWRGTAKGIAIETVLMMKNHFGSNPDDIHVGIGPSIGPENYEVDMPVYKAFAEAFSYSPEFFSPGKSKGKFMLDLWKANKMQLLSAGINEANIEISQICTFDKNDEFFSARKGDLGRFAAGIMIL